MACKYPSLTNKNIESKLGLDLENFFEEDKVREILAYMDTKEFISEFGDYKSYFLSKDSNLDDFFYDRIYEETGEPSLYYDKDLKKFFYLDSLNERVYYPFDRNGLDGIFTSNEINELSESLSLMLAKEYNLRLDIDKFDYDFKEINLREFVEEKLNALSDRLNDSDSISDMDKADQVADSLEHIEEWVSRIKSYFASQKILFKESEYKEAEDLQEEEESQKGFGGRKESFTKSQKTNMLNNVKMFLSLIEDTKKNSFGLYRFIPFDDIYSTLFKTLSDTVSVKFDGIKDGKRQSYEDMFDVYLEKIKELEGTKPYIKNLVDKLENPEIATDTFKNQFVSAFYLFKKNFLGSEFSINEDGSRSYYVMNLSESGSRKNNILNSWYDNFLKQNSNEKLDDAISELKKFNQDFNLNWKKYEESDFNNILRSVSKVLSEVGITTSPEGLKYYLNNNSLTETEFDFKLKKISKLMNNVLYKRVITPYLDPKKRNTLFNENIFKLQSSELGDLANAEAFFMEETSDASIYTLGKTKWSYSNPSFLDIKIAEWKKNPESLLAHYESNPFHENSYIMRFLLGMSESNGYKFDKELSKERLSKIEIGVFNSLQEENDAMNASEGDDISYTDTVVDFIHKTLGSATSGTGGKSWFKTALAADKSTEYQINYGVDLVSANARYENNEYQIDDRPIDILLGYFLDEYSRMNRVASEIKEGKNLYPNYHLGNVNGLRSQLFPEISPVFSKGQLVEIPNANLSFSLFDENGFPKFQNLTNSQKQEIKDTIIKPVLIKKIKEVNEMFISENIIGYNREGVLVNNSIDKNLFEAYYNESSKNVSRASLRLAGDLFINGIISQVEYSKMFTGDVAYYKSSIDYRKRVPATYTDGLYLNVFNQEDMEFNVAVIENVEIDEPSIEYLKEYTSKDVWSQFVSEEGGRKPVDSTDAQAWISHNRWRFLLEKMGKWTKEHDAVWEQMQKEVPVYTEAQKKLIAQPLKGVYFDNHKGRPVFLKYSQAVLVPNLVRNIPDLSNLLSKMQSQKIDEIVTLSGIKVGMIQPIKIHDENGKLLKDFKLNKMPLNNRFWKLQQDLPTKGFKLTDLGSQIQKNIFQALAFNLDTKFQMDNGVEYTGDEMIDLLNSLSTAILYENKNKVFTSLGIDPNKYEIKNANLLYSEIVKQLEERKDVPSNVINGFKMQLSPYGIPGGTELFQNVFSSIINNKINKIKTNGGGFIQMADFGITKSELSNKKGIKFTPWFLDSKDERAMMPQFAKDENGKDIVDPKTGKKKLIPAGIFIPANLISKHIPDYQKYTPEQLFGKLDKKTNKYVGGMIDQEILSNIIGYRIPNQGLVSNDAYRVLGILPESMGDTVIAYAGITKKTGSDFDIDKLYLMVPSFNFDSRKNKLNYVYPKTNKDGTYSDLNEQDIDQLRNLLISAYKNILLQGDPKIMDKIFKPLDLDFFQRDIDNLNPAKEESAFDLFNPIDDISTKIKYKTSKAGLGVAVNNTMDFVRGSMGFMALNFKLPWGNTKEITAINSFGKEYQKVVSKLDEEFSESLTDSELQDYLDDFNSRVSEEQKIKDVDSFKRMYKRVQLSDTFTALTNAFVDVANNPFIVEGNWVNQTNNMAFMLVRAGVHPFKINAFLNQPIIKEFVSYKNNIESKSVEGTRNPVMGFKIKKIAEKLSAEDNDIISIGRKSFTPRKLFYSISKDLEAIQYVNINSVLPNDEESQKDYDNFKKKIEQFKSNLRGLIINRFNLLNDLNPVVLEQVESVQKDLTKVIDEIIFTEAVKFESITLKDLRKQNIEGETDIDIQESIINKYLQWTQLAKSASKSVSASRTDVDGKGKNIVSLIINTNKVKDAYNDENLIGFETKYSRNGKRTSLGSSLDLSIKMTSKIMESNPKFFAPYNKSIINTFNTMSEELKGTILLNENLGNELSKAYTTYLLSGFEPFRLTPSEKKSIIKSMPQTVKELQKKYPDNKFLQELYLKESEVVKDEKGNPIGREFQVGMSNAKKSVSVINSIVDSFRDLIELEPEISEDLIRYAFLTSGGVKTSSSFYEYIPYEWFNKNRFNQYLKNQTERESEHVSMASVNMSFARQFMRSNLKNRSLVPQRRFEIYEDESGNRSRNVSVPAGAKALGLKYTNVFQLRGPDLPPYVSFEEQYYGEDGMPTFKFKGYYERLAIVTNSNGTKRGVYVRTTPLGMRTKTGARVLEYDIFNKRTIDLENESIFDENKDFSGKEAIQSKEIIEYIKSNPDNLDFSTGAFGAMSLISEHSMDEIDKLTPVTDTPQARAKKVISEAVDKNIPQPIKNEAKTPLAKESNKAEINQRYYDGDITPEENTVFVFGSNPEGRHGAGAAKVAKDKFGAKYGQSEGLQGNSYALPTKNIVGKLKGGEIHFPNNAQHNVKEKWQTAAGQFRQELLDSGITSTHDAIKAGLRTGTSRAKTQNVKVGQVINVGKYGEPIAAVVTKVYDKTLQELLDSGEMTKEQWSKREGWSVDYLDKNPQVLNKYPVDFVAKTGSKSISPVQITESIKSLYEVAKQNPNKKFKVAYRNTTEKSLNGYTGLEMIEMFNEAGPIPSNVIFSKEWFDTGKLNFDKIDDNKKQEEKTINIYYGSNENAELSNFAKRPFNAENFTGDKFNTVEGAFQAEKLYFSSTLTEKKTDNSGKKPYTYTLLTEKGESIYKQLQTATGAQAKSIGRRIPNLNIKEWDKVSEQKMKDNIYFSFEQNPDALQKLLDTGNAVLTHTQDKGKWGKLFPKILMEVREELRKNVQENLDNSEKSDIFVDAKEGFEKNTFAKQNNLPFDLYLEYYNSLRKEVINDIESIDDDNYYFSEFVLEKQEQIYNYIDNENKMPEETRINLDYYSAGFNYPYQEDPSLISLGKYNPETGIHVRPKVTVEEFINYIEGNDNSNSSKSKKIVFEKMVNEFGYNKEELLKLLQTEDDVKAFLIFHEISHLENKDTDKLRKERKKYAEEVNKDGETVYRIDGLLYNQKEANEKWIEAKNLLPGVIAFETRATIDAFNMLKLMQDKHRLALKDKFNLANTKFESKEEYYDLVKPMLGLTIEEFKNYLKEARDNSQLGFDFGDQTCN